MNINNLAKLCMKPNIYEPGSATMWTDTHISKQLLNIHLNKDMDLASRKHTTIKSTVDWILSQAEGENLSILDLGCGPGLYAERLAEKGHQVTAVDFSKTSIDYAMSEAKKRALSINYIQHNYLELDFINQFDLVILIYTDLGVLNLNDRQTLLINIHKALKPGGIFIFDILNDTDLEQKVTPKNWEASNQGFWKDSPHLALSESFLYPKEKVILYQHIIVDETDKIDLYRFWTHFFSDEDLKNMLSCTHFENIQHYKNIIPEEDLYSGKHVTFTVATKPTQG